MSQEGSPPLPTLSFRKRLGRIVLSSAFQRLLLAVFLSTFLSFLMLEFVRAPSEALQSGDVSEQDVRAPRTFEVVDDEATRLRREQAARAVHPVFELDARQTVVVRERLAEAFRQGRSWLQGQEPGGEGVGTPPTNGGINEALRQSFAAALGVELSPETMRGLVALRFELVIEDAITTLVQEVLAIPILVSPEQLTDSFLVTGISVVELGGPQRVERVIFSREDVYDLTRARQRVNALAREKYAERPAEQQAVISSLAALMLVGNLTYNEAATEKRRADAAAAIQSVKIKVKKGTMVVRRGDPIDDHRLLILQALTRMEGERSELQVLASVGLFVFVLLAVSYLFATSYIRKFANSMKDLATASLILSFVVALTRIGAEIANALSTYIQSIPANAYYFAIPLACGAMIIRILMNSETALLFSILASALASMVLEYNGFYLAFFFISSLAAAGGIAHTKERVHVLRGGLFAGAVNMLCVLAMALIQSNGVQQEGSFSFQWLALQLTFALAGGLMASVVTLGVVPFFEMFGYVTDYKLLELANLNHPLLKDLMLRAPGTYHHSVIVGQLSEAAAQAIRANALLARVGCLYHDIGKMKKPEYFIENLRNVSENRHDHLPAHVSALIIASHVRDGIELARQHRLPQSIIDLIPGHHGTSLISFFYNKARTEAGSGELINENDFRYPGPKPRTREAGIVMLADATEASTRSIKNPNMVKIRLNLQKIFQRVISDGQLDECPLTLQDLATVLDSFMKTLQGIHHNRIEYPPEVRGGAAIAGVGTGAVLTHELDPHVTADRPGLRPVPADARSAKPLEASVAGAASAKGAAHAGEHALSTTLETVVPSSPVRPEREGAASTSALPMARPVRRSEVPELPPPSPLSRAAMADAVTSEIPLSLLLAELKAEQSRAGGVHEAGGEQGLDDGATTTADASAADPSAALVSVAKSTSELAREGEALESPAVSGESSR